MKKLKITLVIMTVIALVASCTKKGEPNKQGEIVTTEQMKKISTDQSMNGKQITVEGYAGLCNSMFVTKGIKNEMAVYSDGFCKGEKLLNLQIKISKGDIPLTGDEPRNFGSFADDKNLSNESLTFMTDDYQEVKNGKLKFSGTVVYKGNDFSLDNVTIHK